MIRTRHGAHRETSINFFEICKEQLISNGYLPHETLFIFPAGGLGEFTYILSLSSELRKESKVAIFLPDNKLDFSLLYPDSADIFISYPSQCTKYLSELYLISIKKPGYPFVPYTDYIADGRFNIELVSKEGRLTLKEGYAYLLGLPLGTTGKNVKVPKLSSAEEIKISSNKKNILIIPHANSHKSLPDIVWENLISSYDHNKYNFHIENTKLTNNFPSQVTFIKLGINELLKCLSRYDGVIALRSGLADLICSVNSTERCKIAIIYHITENPPFAEQKYNHTKGVSLKGLALTRIYSTDEKIKDFEVDGDNYLNNNYKEIIEFIS